LWIDIPLQERSEAGERVVGGVSAVRTTPAYKGLAFRESGGVSRWRKAWERQKRHGTGGESERVDIKGEGRDSKLGVEQGKPKRGLLRGNLKVLTLGAMKKIKEIDSTRRKENNYSIKDDEG